MVQATVVVRIRITLNLDMKRRYFFTLVLASFSLIVLGQNPTIGEESVLHHLDKIREHADSLGRLFGTGMHFGNEQDSAISSIALVAENEELQSQLNSALGELKVSNQARVDEISSLINIYHSEWRFAAEDWVVFVENIEVIQDRIDSWKEAVAGEQLPLAENSRIQLEELSISIGVMAQAVNALAQPTCYFKGIDDELKAGLRDVVVSMRDGAEVVIKLLGQAQVYRQYACSMVSQYGIMPFEDAMKGYIFGDQFDPGDDGPAISFNVSKELAESTATEATDDLILNEERVNCYTWLNETMFEATLNATILKTVCPQ